MPDQMLEATLAVKLSGEELHRLSVSWSDEMGRLIHQDDSLVDARFGKQEFTLRFWLKNRVALLPIARERQTWSVRVYIDGALIEEQQLFIAAG